MKLLRTIRNCRVSIDAPCPKQWEALTPTGDAAVRFCASCTRQVYLCETDEQTLAHARAGDCIARAVPERGEMGPMVVGRPSVTSPPTESQETARKLIHREHAIDDILSWDFSAYDRFCPECHFPVPSFRPSCRVCGFMIGRA